MKNGKISLKRTFPRKYGVVNLVWTVRDCDGTDFGCQPGLAAQAKRLLFRAKALRDLQALLMADLNAGGSLPKVQHAFYFMCWLIPLTEERFDLPSTLDSELCSKQGWPLQGFSDVSAADVWAEMPSILRASILHWLDAKYTAATAGRGYHLCKHVTIQLHYSNQQIEAWGERSLELMHAALDKLNANSKQDTPDCSCGISAEATATQHVSKLQRVLRRRLR